MDWIYFQTIVASFSNEKSRLSNVEESLQKVLRTTHTDGHGSLSNDLKEVKHKFDSTEENAKSCCKYLEELLKQMSDYEKRINEVQGWMKEVENSLQSICLKEGLPEKRTQLEKIKVHFKTLLIFVSNVMTLLFIMEYLIANERHFLPLFAAI